MAFTIRAANSDDLDRVLALYQHLSSIDAAAPEALAQMTFEIIISSPNLTIFLLEQNGQACASCYLNIIENLTRGCRSYAVIENVVTHPDLRQQGMAKAVLMHALDVAWAANCYKVMLLTGKPALVSFYEKCGFDAAEKSALIARNPAL